MKLNYPKVKIDSNQKVYVTLLINKKRYRIFSGERVNSKTNPNSFPIEQRLGMGNILAAEAYSYIINGGVLKSYRTDDVVTGKLSDKEYLSLALEKKLKGSYSTKYKKMLRVIYNAITTIMNGDSLNSNHIHEYLDRYTSNTSFNTVRRHLNVLVNEAVSNGMIHNPMDGLKSRKSKSKLHKPFKNIAEILNEIKYYNTNLHLCCILTYGCLLRPHREIRELTWGDFSEDLSSINLSGERNKSGRNRIVPVPMYVRNFLIKGDDNHNIFTNTINPMSEDYFKGLWRRFKKRSNKIQSGQTLYSFRHSGAIDVFKRTGSLTKLQEAMGHSSLNVSLTYLRGLEVPQLKEEDMPSIY